MDLASLSSILAITPPFLLSWLNMWTACLSLRDPMNIRVGFSILAIQLLLDKSARTASDFKMELR